MEVYTMSRIYSLSDLKFIKPSMLRSWFAKGSPTGTGKFVVVDVRESDYVGGHIRGCYHYPAADFHSTMDELQDRLMENGVEDVVFHCALSQARGPKSALRFLRATNDIYEPKKKEALAGINVWVLQGGFTKWQEEYGDDLDVTEAYDKDIWRFGNL